MSGTDEQITRETLDRFNEVRRIADAEQMGVSEKATAYVWGIFGEAEVPNTGETAEYLARVFTTESAAHEYKAANGWSDDEGEVRRIPVYGPPS